MKKNLYIIEVDYKDKPLGTDIDVIYNEALDEFQDTHYIHQVIEIEPDYHNRTTTITVLASVR